MKWLSFHWLLSHPRPGRRLRQRRAIERLLRATDCPWSRRWTWRDRLGCLADRVADLFTGPWTPARRLAVSAWLIGVCSLAHLLIGLTTLWLYAHERPTAGGGVVPVNRMPATDSDPEPPLRVERRTTWCPQPR